jgi:hypothetical protein
VLALKDNIQKLETKVQRFVEFRERLVRILGIRAVSVPDSEIFDRVESLARMRPSSAIDNVMTLSSSTLHPLSYVNAHHLPHHQ